MLVTLKLQPELIVEHPEIAIATAHDRFRHYHADFLGNYANIGFLFTIIDKSIEAEAIVETAKQFDVVLEPDIGAPAAATRHGPRATRTAANMATAPRPGGAPRWWGRAAGLLPRCRLGGGAAPSPRFFSCGAWGPPRFPAPGRAGGVCWGRGPCGCSAVGRACFPARARWATARWAAAPAAAPAAAAPSLPAPPPFWPSLPAPCRPISRRPAS